MTEALRPVLELAVVIPGLLLAYIPMKTYLKQPVSRLLIWLSPLLAALVAGGGLVCYSLRVPTGLALALLAAAASAIYVGTLRVSLWKSATVALSVCAVFACLNSLSRALDATIAVHQGAAENEMWFCLRTGVCYNAMCWLTVAIACYPAGHIVRRMIEDDNFAQTWYTFWILPLIFIALNLFMVPQRRETLYTGRVLQGYVIISFALLILLLWFNIVFLMMANSLNRNAKLQQENHFLSIQQERYENLKTAIEDARQARHDMRHHFNQISTMVENEEWAAVKTYLTGVTGRLPGADMSFCENRAADSVIGYYCALARRESVPFHVRADLPAQLPIDEIDMCLVLSNLLENALEASLQTAPARRQIAIQAHMHSNRLLLIQVQNAFDGEIHEKSGIFQSSKRRGNGMGVQSVRRIAEKSGGASTFTHENGVFSAKVMLRG